MKVQGVNGVLQTLLTEPTESETSKPMRPVPAKKPPRPKVKTTSKYRTTARARIGRLPESASGGTERQKVTFRIRPDLIDGYRDWSWDARTSVSHLVEAALDEYFTHRKR
jgi:hypothetical protein